MEASRQYLAPRTMECDYHSYSGEDQRRTLFPHPGVNALKLLQGHPAERLVDSQIQRDRFLEFVKNE
jgi:hypothetical protein